MVKEYKTLNIKLLSGEQKRVVKSDVRCVEEQRNIWGGVSVEVWMMSGRAYQTAEAKIDLEERIYGAGTKYTSLEA